MVIKWDEMVFVKKVRNRLLLFPRRPSFISSNTSAQATRQHKHTIHVFDNLNISVIDFIHPLMIECFSVQQQQQ